MLWVVLQVGLAAASAGAQDQLAGFEAGMGACAVRAEAQGVAVGAVLREGPDGVVMELSPGAPADVASCLRHLVEAFPWEDGLGTREIVIASPASFLPPPSELFEAWSSAGEDTGPLARRLPETVRLREDGCLELAPYAAVRRAADAWLVGWAGGPDWTGHGTDLYHDPQRRLSVRRTDAPGWDASLSQGRAWCLEALPPEHVDVSRQVARHLAGDDPALGPLRIAAGVPPDERVDVAVEWIAGPDGAVRGDVASCVRRSQRSLPPLVSTREAIAPAAEALARGIVLPPGQPRRVRIRLPEARPPAEVEVLPVDLERLDVALAAVTLSCRDASTGGCLRTMSDVRAAAGAAASCFPDTPPPGGVLAARYQVEPDGTVTLVEGDAVRCPLIGAALGPSEGAPCRVRAWLPPEVHSAASPP